MDNSLYAEWQAYTHFAWKQGLTALSYEEWLEARVADLTTALTPFARFGLLKHPYSAEAVFTLVHDRDGHKVVLHFGDFIEALRQIPGLTLTPSETRTVGAAGGIAEIMETKP